MRLECDLGSFLGWGVLSPSIAAFSWFFCLESQVFLHSWRESFLSTLGAGDPWTLGLCFNQIQNLMFHHLYHSLSYPLLQIHCHLQFLYASSPCGLVWFWCFWIRKAWGQRSAFVVTKSCMWVIFALWWQFTRLTMSFLVWLDIIDGSWTLVHACFLSIELRAVLSLLHSEAPGLLGSVVCWHCIYWHDIGKTTKQNRLTVCGFYWEAIVSVLIFIMFLGTLLALTSSRSSKASILIRRLLDCSWVMCISISLEWQHDNTIYISYEAALLCSFIFIICQDTLFALASFGGCGPSVLLGRLWVSLAH